jgi:hypothetical protein
MRLLDAEQQGADWRDVSWIVMRIDPNIEPDRRVSHSQAIWRVLDG